jgi:2,4-dienoyl-CoA reductase-like NADH-dependent reductase (Old Yellow Enzyme family)
MYQAVFADVIRCEAGTSTAVVGLIVKGEEAEKVLEDGKADFILVAREFLRDSSFVLRSAQALNLGINWPKQYSWAANAGHSHSTSKADAVKSDAEN